MGKHLFRKKMARAVKEGKQSTLVSTKEKQPIGRLLTAEEAKCIYHSALAEIWGCPVENIRSHGYALPVITYYK